MRRLLIDLGNTRIKWAWDMSGDLVHAGEALRNDDAWLERLPIEPAPDEVHAVNVAGPEAAAALDTAVDKRFGMRVRFQQTAAACGAVRNGYTATEQLGADRWAAIVGAYHRYREPLCVVDAGTAVTIDLVDADGRHRGGVILPGVRLMSGVLLSDTSDIGDFVVSTRGDVPAGDWFGRDTATAVSRGALFALRSAIAAAARSGQGAAAALPVVLTGGDAESLAPLDGLDVRIRPLLVLEGLRELVRHAREADRA